MASNRWIGHYEILRPLGEGGMGTVFLARDTRLERDVAIKVLRSDLTLDQDHTARLEVEAKLLASLNHPNIASIFDLMDRDGVLHLILERVEGRSLDDHLKTGALRLNDVLTIGRQVAAALSAAHHKGIVHRDLKPANIMLGPKNTVKVLDFGIALVQPLDGGTLTTSEVPLPSGEEELARLESMGAHLTSMGVVVGTTPYLSPEQLAGHEIDKRADIWSFGCLLYELAAGRTPFWRRTVVATLAAILHEDPDLSGLPATTPPELVTLIERCLRKDKDMRLHDIADARIVLEDLSAAKETEAPPSGPRSRLLIVAGLVVSALILLIGTNLRPTANPDGTVPVVGEASLGPGSVAVRSFVTNSDSVATILARGLRDELVSTLSRVGAITVVSNAATTRYDVAGAPSTELAQGLGVASVLEGTAERRGDDLRVTVSLVGRLSQTLWSETYTTSSQTEDVFEFQARLAGEIASSLSGTLTREEVTPREVSPTSNLDAYTLYVRGNGYALARFEREPSALAIDMYEQAIALDSTFALAYARLAQAHSLFFQFFDPTQARQEAALDALTKALTLSPDLPEARLAQGYVSYWVVNDLEGALAEIEPLSIGSTDPEVYWILGSLQRRLERMEDSKANFTHAIELDPTKPIYRFELAVTSWLMRDLVVAEGAYQGALDLDPESLAARLAKALFLFVEGRDQEANQLYLEGLRYHSLETLVSMLIDPRYRHVLGLASPVFLEALDTLDSQNFDPGPFHLSKALLHGAENRSTARTYFDSARVVFEQRVADRPGDALSQASLGIALAGVGQAEEALDHAETAAALVPIRQDALAGFFYVLELARVQALAGYEEDAVTTLTSLIGHSRLYSRRLFEQELSFAPLRGRADFERFLSALDASRE